MADLLKLKRELEAISKILSQSLDNINFEIENKYKELCFYSKYVKVQFVYLLSILYTTLLLTILYFLMNWHHSQVNQLNATSVKFQKISYDKGYNDCTNKYKQFFLDNPAAMHDFEIWVDNLE
ncbi:MAG TPA: hypothetical protein VK164_02505 [Flavobacterium sp.]|uniref:hypothetical protein n=1 Tax=Flavobacterium sp. TaxID=239 RepID=UPI002B4AF895|nr:hypothetical protein [Flavobacterium sp.]HLO72784.1 hypothetical protein [Flavobacterium sp.]